MAFTYTGEGVETRKTPKLPPEGEYYVQITKGEEKISQAGKNMIALTCQIMHNEYHNEIREYIVENQYAQQRIYDILASCGTPPSPGQPIGAQSFIGKSGQVRIGHELYDGEKYPRIKYWKTRGENPAQTPASSESSAPAQPALVDQIPF